MKARSVDLGLLRRGIDKLLIGPIKYRSRGGYDAERFWDDRLRSYGLSLRGVGHEGLSEAANSEEYAQAAAVFRRTIQPLVGDRPPKTLEVGSGTGFYTSLLQQMGVRDYTGFDITDALFGSLRERFTGYRFVQGDITVDTIRDAFDLVVMIDVTEHIVSTRKFQEAMSNLKGSTLPGGYVVIGPQFDKGSRHLFYVHFWSIDQVDEQFDGWQHLICEDFRGGKLLVYRKPS